MKEKVNELFLEIHNYLDEQYGSTKAGLNLFLIVLNVFGISFIVYESLGSMKGILVFLMIVLIACAITALLKGACWILQRFFVYYGIWSIVLNSILFALVVTTLISGITPAEYSFLPAIAVVVVEAVFARCLYALIKNRKRNLFVIIPLCFALVANLGLVYFCLWDGQEMKYIKSCYEQNEQFAKGNKEVEHSNQYQVLTFDYGMKEEEQVKTRTVDMSPYMESYTGLRKWMRDRYWGYGVDEIPLEGRVWYPKEEGSYPILFIIHGNANMVKQSYLGYDYLGKYLAREGYIVVSVNENWCNYYMGLGFHDENDARAVLLLENMKEVLRWNQISDNPLYQKISSDQVAIAGHSRGGEAVAIANEFNSLSFYPDDANQRFDYHFPIKTVFAIAPTSNQYNPSGRTVPIKNVNYFLVHGSWDQDVTSMMGMNQYNHVELADGCQKAYLYIAGANHGQFNTRWGRYDSCMPANLVLNTKPILKAQEQRTILKQYLKVCLDTTLKGQEQNSDFIWDIDRYGKNVPKTVYLQGYQNASYEPLAEYEEDMDITTANDGITIKANGFAEWSEVNSNQHEDYNSENHAVYLKWQSTREAAYELEFSPRDLSKKVLLFDVMNLRTQDTSEATPKMLNFTIQFTDSNGKTASVCVKDQETVYPITKVVYSKIVALFDRVTYRPRFQTVNISLEDLQKNHLDVDFERIQKIRFQCDRNPDGEMLLDHIGLQS